MHLFMEPKSVAVIGASRRIGEDSFNAFENLVKFGFKGRVYPVNPSVKEILGIKTSPSIKEIPEIVDLALISTPNPPVLGLVKECIENGIKAIIVVSGGFADSGDDGKYRQAEIVRMAKQGKARIIGPNSLGVANFYRRLHTAFVPELEMEETSIGVICQSGLFFCGLSRQLLIGKIIDLGNCCDVDFADCLEYFEDDPETKLILMHIEGIRDGRRFMQVARRVANKKPVLALKTGRSEQGSKMAQSHSGSMAGRDEVYDAVFKQCGVMRVNDLDEMEDMTKAFLALPPMKTKGIAIATVVYGGAVSSVDACQEYGLDVVGLSAETIAKIRKVAPDWLSIKNPVDLGALNFLYLGLKKSLSIVTEALMNDEHVSALLLICPAMKKDFWGVLKTAPEFARRFRDKPVVCWLYGNHFNEFAIKLEESKCVVAFPTLERAIHALARLREYSETKGRSLAYNPSHLTP